MLSAIIVVALKGLFVHFKDLKKLWPSAKVDFVSYFVELFSLVFETCFIISVPLPNDKSYSFCKVNIQHVPNLF